MQRLVKSVKSRVFRTCDNASRPFVFPSPTPFCVRPTKEKQTRGKMIPKRQRQLRLSRAGGNPVQTESDSLRRNGRLHAVTNESAERVRIMDAMLAVHLACTWFMTGLIWFVQLVHYPLFAHVGADGFERYEKEHVRRTTWVVAPVMLVELATAAWLLVDPPGALPAWLAWMNAAMLAGIWLSTILIQVLAHRVLERGFSAHAQRRLVQGNWLRTMLWTLRATFLSLLPILRGFP